MKLFSQLFIIFLAALIRIPIIYGQELPEEFAGPDKAKCGNDTVRIGLENPPPDWCFEWSPDYHLWDAHAASTLAWPDDDQEYTLKAYSIKTGQVLADEVAVLRHPMVNSIVPGGRCCHVPDEFISPADISVISTDPPGLEQYVRIMLINPSHVPIKNESVYTETITITWEDRCSPFHQDIELDVDISVVNVAEEINSEETWKISRLQGMLKEIFDHGLKSPYSFWEGPLSYGSDQRKTFTECCTGGGIIGPLNATPCDSIKDLMTGKSGRLVQGTIKNEPVYKPFILDMGIDYWIGGNVELKVEYDLPPLPTGHNCPATNWEPCTYMGHQVNLTGGLHSDDSYSVLPDGFIADIDLVSEISWPQTEYCYEKGAESTGRLRMNFRLEGTLEYPNFGTVTGPWIINSYWVSDVFLNMY